MKYLAKIIGLTATRGHLVIWANDHHISPIHDLKSVLVPLNVSIIDMTMSNHCHITKTCQNKLKVLNKHNSVDLLEPNITTKFYNYYKTDALMKTVDAYVCFHPAAMCEVFMPFKKPIIVIASTRYELGRFQPARWKKWNENLIEISKDPRNIVGANNLYDLEYIRYFTGINGVLLPSFCDYTNVSYQPIANKTFLLAPIRAPGFQDYFLKERKKALQKNNISGDGNLKPLRAVYGHYKYTDLIKHPGIVYVPYQVSTMSLFEHYRMNIPLFFPSIDLLAKWQLSHMVIRQRTWEGVRHRRAKGSSIPGVLNVPDPNNDSDLGAIKHWIKYADFYQWPHITYYESLEDLIWKLNNTNLKEVSENMKIFNKKAKEELVDKWEAILDKIAGV